jgi:1-acyl-sn-glycerol-3-phosphate acyltransferase
VYKIFYPLSRLFLKAFAFFLLRLDVQHHQLLPPGPKLYVANHPSATDPFLIHLVSKEDLNVMITESAFRVPFFGWYLRKVEQIPVRMTLEGGVTAIEQARRHLERGRSVAIFIEGHISPEEGGFLAPRAGAARIALGVDVPVIPVGIYLRRNWRLNISSGISGEQTEAFWYFHGPYTVTVGKPQYYYGDGLTNQVVRTTSKLIMNSIQSLAAESELRGQRVMKSSLLIQVARWLAPVWRFVTTPS